MVLWLLGAIAQAAQTPKDLASVLTDLQKALRSHDYERAAQHLAWPQTEGVFEDDARTSAVARMASEWTDFSWDHAAVTAETRDLHDAKTDRSHRQKGYLSCYDDVCFFFVKSGPAYRAVAVYWNEVGD